MSGLCELFIYLGLLSFYPYLIIGLVLGYILGCFIGWRNCKIKYLINKGAKKDEC